MEGSGKVSFNRERVGQGKGTWQVCEPKGTEVAVSEEMT